MKQNFKGLAIASLVGATLIAPNTFAADFPYDMAYSGGDPLGSNNVSVLQNVNLINLIPVTGTTLTTSGSEWKSGYMTDPDDSCHEFKYVTVNSSKDLSNVSFTLTKDSYSAVVGITHVDLQQINYTGNENSIAVGVVPGRSYIYGGTEVFSNATCSSQIDTIKTTHRDTDRDNRIFVRTNITLKKNNQAFVHDGLYFGVIDIDAAQSFRILNSGNGFGGNMYVKSADAIGNLQPSEDPAGLKNRLVTSNRGDYIYSQYNKSGGTAIQTPSSNVFVPLSTSTQSNGLDMIFGYVNAAGSAIEYEIQQLNVRYVSDSNGTINGIENEVKFLNDTASGSSSEPNENYVFSHWIADKNVTLTDGTTIQAGKPITSEQLKKVIVDTNLVFTAIHKPQEQPLEVKYVSDENGEIVGIHDEEKVSGDTASGSSSEPNKNYVFSYWIADKDVTLTDGTTIQAGKPITSEQLKKVVVETNLTFTAIHKPKEEEKPEIVVPDTGASTGNHEGTILVNLAAVFAALGVVVSLVRRHINHRLNRVHFNKK